MLRTGQTRHVFGVPAAWFSASAIFLCWVQSANSQPLAPPDPVLADNTLETSDGSVVLSPFVLDASEDKEQYKANSTLAGTRVRTDLRDTASAISVVTTQFLKDTGAKNSQDLLVYTTNTEVAGLGGNFSGQAGSATYNESLVNPNATTRIRGLDAADSTRNYFITDIPWDAFNTGRVDIQRGPNSILFGAGSPAGIINSSVNGAAFVNSENFENVVGSYGSIRNSVDVNSVLRPNELAVRIALLDDDEKYQQEPAFDHQKRLFAAGRWDPKIFNQSSHTSITANFEKGSISSNNPRDIPPTDLVTPWFATGTYYGNPALNKATIDEYVEGDRNSPAAVKFVPGSASQPGAGELVTSIFNGAGANGAIPPQSATPTSARVDLISSGYAIDANGQPFGILTGALYFVPLTVPPLSALGLASLDPSSGLNPIPGGGFFVDKVIQDPSTFDFFNHLLDGPTKKEWQNWRAFDGAFSQTFFDNRLAFELAYNAQTYVAGSEQAIGNFIAIDPNVTFADGTLNPNVGRPFVGGVYANSDHSQTIDRQSVRFTSVLDLRSQDLFGPGKISWILGHSVVTGIIDEDRRESTTLIWSLYASDHAFASVLDPITSYPSYGGAAGFFDYLGPSLLGNLSAAGAHISPVTEQIEPVSNNAVPYFNSHWIKSLNPNDPNFVDPSAPFLAQPASGQPSYLTTQSGNLANYAGWQTASVTFLNAHNPQQFPELVSEGGAKSKYVDLNKGLTWQGYLLGGSLVPVFGYRVDAFTNYLTAGPQDLSTGIHATNYAIDPKSRTSATGDSKSWGGVYHIPRSWTSGLPGDTNISVFYDSSSNFKAEAPRENVIGGALANPQGKTREVGFIVSTLSDRVSLKVNWYRTVEANATLQSSIGNSIGGFGASGYILWAAPAWGYQAAALVQSGLQGLSPDSASRWNYLENDGVSNNGPGDPVFDNSPETALEHRIVNAWLHFPLDASFFNFYGINPFPIDPALGLASGNLLSVFGPGYNLNTRGAIGAEQWNGSVNAVTTNDLLSKGEEVEVSAQIISNWNFTLNYARTSATHQNVDPTTSAFFAKLYTFFSGDGGQLRIFGGTADQAIGPQWIAEVYNPYLLEVATEGHSAPEVAPWRLNLITSYTIDRGFAKGAFFGGGARLEAGKILGYAFDPATNFLDVDRPWMGRTDQHFDSWIGYSRKINSKKIAWRIQLNLRNVGEKAHLVASSVEPDGSVALATIQEGMTYRLTNSFDF